MRRAPNFLLPALLLALVAGCGAIKTGETAAMAPGIGGVDPMARPLDMAVIETQTLAPPQEQDAPPSGQAMDAPAAAIAPMTPQEAECIRQGGRWGGKGNTTLMTCYRTTKDAGKACTRKSDCTSECLARSRSCAPFWPIFGCTDVLLNDGSAATLCLD